MEFGLPEKESVKELLSKLNQELHHERVDRYAIERDLNRINSLQEDIIAKSHEVQPRDRGTLIPLIHTIQDDLYKLQGSTWRSVYLLTKRTKREEEMIRLKRDLYEVERESENLIAHVEDVNRLIKELKPKHESATIGAAIVFIAMSGFLFSSFQSYKIFVQPYTGLSVLPSIGLIVYFFFATLLVLAMFAFIFGFRKK